MSRGFYGVGAWLLTALAPCTAVAGTLDPYVWGVGARLGSTVIPGGYPALFPDRIGNYDFVQEGPLAGDDSADEPDRDLDANGDPLETSIDKVRADLRLGAEAVYGVDAHNRLGLGFGGAFGTRFSDLWFTANYDRVLAGQNGINLVGGLQTGFGSMKFTGSDDDETLRIPYFPIRARIGAELLNNSQQYGLDAAVGTGIPSRHAYTDLEGVDQQVQSPFNFVNYIFVAIELKVLFGDFDAT